MIETPWGIFPNTEAAADAHDETPTFVTGDLVTLVSGGPPLSVIDHCDDCGETEVAWFEGDALRIATFPEDVLVLIEDDEPDTLH